MLFSSIRRNIFKKKFLSYENVVPLLNKNLIWKDDNFVVFEKSENIQIKFPNFSYLSKKAVNVKEGKVEEDVHNKIFLQNKMSEIRDSLQWREIYPIFAPDNFSEGIVIYTNNSDYWNKYKRLMERDYRTKFTPYQNYIVVTEGINEESISNWIGEKIFFQTRYNYQNRKFISQIIEKVHTTKSKRKQKIILSSYIKWKTLDVNRDLNVSLIHLKTSSSIWNSIQLYFAHNQLMPIIGDKFYSHLVNRQENNETSPRKIQFNDRFNDSRSSKILKKLCSNNNYLMLYCFGLSLRKDTNESIRGTIEPFQNFHFLKHLETSSFSTDLMERFDLKIPIISLDLSNK
ncbi:hypothetical protein SNEBB_003327 [Seison nebaliae]|nr:hypothetical protein SNEBB_003327 [Seison nebaliae]